MLNRVINHALWIALFLFSLSVSIFAQDLLKESDVNNIMKQIFEEHIDKKEMSKDILQHAFKVYIDQFDPEKTYVLQEEIHPFLSPTNEEMATYIDQYKQGNYAVFEKLNAVIQKSIIRSRGIRDEIEKNRGPLFDAAEKLHYSKADEYNSRESKIDYAKNVDELKERNTQQIEHFIKSQMHQYGTAAIMSKQPQVLGFYNKVISSNENNWLFLDQHDRPMEAPQKENLMTLHILKALANSLDSHTSFFDPMEAQEMKVHLEKELYGIGVILQQGVDGVVITQIIPNSPASKSGQLNIKDEIIEIDGKTIAGDSFEQIRDLITGKEGSTVTLKVKRNDSTEKDKKSPFTVELKRAPITVNNDRVDVSFEKFGNGIIGKLVLHSFYQGENGVSSEKDLRDAIQQLKKQGNLKGLILDLRDNGGGFLTQAVKVSSLFITDGVVVVSKYSNGEEHYYRDIENKKAFDGPLLILTSKVTASAAEIVAEALQDYGVALVIGDTHTYGKGSIQSQTVTDNKSTSFFKVTVGKYYTVSGNSPQIRGVQADIVVPGPLNFEKLGEQYTDAPLTSDTIAPSFNDSLKDINPEYKPWFMKYYIPTLQKPVQEWKEMIPTLKKNSEYRISSNKNYQLFIKQIEGTADEKEDPDEPLVAGNAKNYGNEDLQMNEAVNIMKDMITLHSFWDNTHSEMKDRGITQGVAK